MKVFGFIVCVLFVAQGSHADKLNIEVLYESLCPDSIRFINNQLAPNYNELADWINVTFVPFGKAYSDDNQEFHCQHGPMECKGNLIQSCALKALTDQSKQVSYVNCFMKTFVDNPVEQGKKCATDAGISWEVVKQCIASDEGMKLQYHAENVTFLYKPAFIPTIVYNQEFSQKAQDSSISGFRNYVCSRLQKTNPEACPPMQLKPIKAF